MKQSEKQNIRGRISLLQAYKENYMRDYKRAKDGTKKKEKLEKKLEDIELAIQLSKSSISRKRPDKKISKEKKCMMCGEPTSNASGFCDNYAGSMFGCKESWMQEYGSKPTQKELNAKWRMVE